jgi:hypothetical protein
VVAAAGASCWDAARLSKLTYLIKAPQRR